MKLNQFIMANYKVIQIDILLHDYNYFNMSPMYLLTEGDLQKKQFITRKPRRNLQGLWYKCEMIGFIMLGGLLSEV